METYNIIFSMKLSQWTQSQEYAPIGGEADFCRESAKLAFGDTSPVVTNGLNVTIQVKSILQILFAR
jgi:aspartate/tyrosine/aromatic aminotransferase